MGKIRLIASDLDGTLLTEKKEITDYTKQVLAAAAGEGILFVPATGRAFTSIPHEVLSLPGVKYVITSNGAAVYSASEGKRIYECLLEPASVDAILDIPMGQYSIALETFVNGVPYTEEAYWEDPRAYGATDFGVEYVRRTRRKVPDIRAFIRENRDRLDSIDFVCPQAEAKTEIRRFLENIDNIYITSSIPHLLEISHKNGGKGQTLAYLAEKEKIRPEEIMAFGDGDNDIEMLQFAALGFAVENGSPACKKSAGRITESNEKEGVAKAIINILKKV